MYRHRLVATLLSQDFYLKMVAANTLSAVRIFKILMVIILQEVSAVHISNIQY